MSSLLASTIHGAETGRKTAMESLTRNREPPTSARGAPFQRPGISRYETSSEVIRTHYTQSYGCRFGSYHPKPEFLTMFPRKLPDCNMLNYPAVAAYARHSLSNATFEPERLFLEQVINICEAYRSLHALNRNCQANHDNSLGRMIPDAADAVRTAALHADAMLSEIQTGWLWRFITKKTNPPKA